MPGSCHPFRPCDVIEHKERILGQKRKELFKVGQCRFFVMMAVDEYIVDRLVASEDVRERVLKAAYDYGHRIKSELLKVLLGDTGERRSAFKSDKVSLSVQPQGRRLVRGGYTDSGAKFKARRWAQGSNEPEE
jgi:hypothetical protein